MSYEREKQRKLNKLIDLWTKLLLEGWRGWRGGTLCLPDWRSFLEHELGRPVYWPEMRRAFATMVVQGLISTYRNRDGSGFMDGRTDHIMVIAGPALRPRINEPEPL